MFWLRFNPVLKLTDYHISQHVVSTFKSLTTTTTHCGLIHFTKQTGYHKYNNPTCKPYIAVCSKHPAPIILASDMKSLDFYRTISIAN